MVVTPTIGGVVGTSQVGEGGSVGVGSMGAGTTVMSGGTASAKTSSSSCNVPPVG